MAGRISMGRKIEGAERADLETAEIRVCKNMTFGSLFFLVLIMRKRSWLQRVGQHLWLSSIVFLNFQTMRAINVENP